MAAPSLEVRLVRLPGAGPDLDRARSLLDRTERVRLGRLTRTADQYAAAHAGLRLLLAPHLDRHPASIGFDRAPCPLCGEPHGRPVARAAPPGLHFSMAHRRGMAAYAVAGRPVGIDIEVLDRPVNLDDLASALHPGERRALDDLPPPARLTAALRCWTRKEAYLKGTGVGLGIDPATIHVGVAGSDHLHEMAGGWTVADVPAGDRHVAAVALADVATCEAESCISPALMTDSRFT